MSVVKNEAMKDLRQRLAPICSWIGQRVKALFQSCGEKLLAAIDATGLESQHTSSYFFKRAGKKHSARLWTKLTVVCDTGSHFITGATVSTGPSNDAPPFAPALNQVAQRLGSALYGRSEESRERECHLRVLMHDVMLLAAMG